MTAILALVTVAAFAVTMGELLPYLYGYPVIADILGSTLILSSFAGTAAVSGLAIAVFAVLAWSVFIRLGRWMFGYKRLAFNGETGYAQLAAAALTTGFKWVRASLFAFVLTGKVAKVEYGSWTVLFTPGRFSRQEV